MRLYNAQSRSSEEFIPLVPNEAGMYVCGPTVYNYIHFGNARPLVVFDILRRYLEYQGYKVNMVSNITDIDDKLIARAIKENTTVEALAAYYYNAFMEDIRALGLLPFTHQPRATQHIGPIIALIRTLINKGYAYAAENGDVYFDTQAYCGYGALSGQNRDNLLSGARVAIDESKRCPMDFALWKAAKPGEPKWTSPWSQGRPGWHIECSAMSMKYLGATFDIHGGGQDLLFPHHENEKAQSEAATGRPFARYWLHNAFINMDGEKMSKSLGNFYTLRDVLADYSGEEIRFFFASAHYRSALNFSREQMEQSRAALSRLYNAKMNLVHQLRGIPAQTGQEITRMAQLLKTRFIEAMDDDLNTAGAIGHIFEFVRQVNQQLSISPSSQGAREALAALTQVCGVLGILQNDTPDIPEQIIELAALREKARSEKNWAESDKLRDEILKLGYAIEDTKSGAKITPL